MACLVRLGGDRDPKLQEVMDGTCLAVSPWKRWIDDIEEDVQQMGVMNWKVTTGDDRVCIYLEIKLAEK